MEWHELRNILNRQSNLAHERRPEYGYARISIGLGDSEYVGTDIPLAFSGDQLAKIKYTGSKTGTYFRLNDKHAQQIYASEFKRVSIPFTKIYLTNLTAQTGKKLEIYIGTGIAVSIEPDSDEIKGTLPEMKTALLGSAADAGADTLTPTVGKAIEVLGFTLHYRELAAAVIATPSSVAFVTSGIYIFYAAKLLFGIDNQYIVNIADIKIRGAVNEVLTLTNANWTTAAAETQATIYYREV